MTLAKIVELLDAEILCGDEHLERAAKAACGADLMSDVLAYHKEDAVLLTGLVNMQVIRTAEMSDIICVVFVRGKRPNREILNLAVETDLPILTTKLPLFEYCGRLYKAGLPGSAICMEDL